MTMKLEVSVAGQQICAVKIVNLTERSGLNDTNTYEFKYWHAGNQLIGQVDHRYGDGAMTLISKVSARIAEMEEQPRCTAGCGGTTHHHAVGCGA